MNSVKKRIIACKIEYHWWRIHRLQKLACKNISISRRQNFDQKMQLHRYEANQLSDLYDVLCGIRNFDNLFVHPLTQSPVMQEEQNDWFSRIA